MKRVLAFLAVSAAILAVSCNKEQDNQGREESNLASVSFTVSQADLMTKADPVDPGYGDATKVNQLLVQVFNKVGDSFVKLDAPEMTITPANSTPASWHVDMKLAKNETYKIAFWAQKSGNTIYSTSDLSQVTIAYSKVAINNDDADAFCAARLVTVNGSLSEKVLLYRPLAQINIGTNDLASYKKSVVADKQNLTATITLPVGTPNKLNVIGGTETNGVVSAAISGNTTEETAFTTAPAYVMEGAKLTSSEKDYDYLTMLYVLAAPGKETMTFKAKLNNGSTDVSDLTVSNMPYQANYRTNIVGQLLTGTFEFNVEVEEGFYADFEKKVSPTFATLADLNAYFATMKDGTPEGDNGDINPEQVTLTALGTVEGTPQIKLPVISGGVDIRVVFDYDGTIEVVYGNESDGAKKPANVFFFAKKLTTLKATVPASHFELLSGSVVTNKAIVSTNTTTFVIQKGAKVGTVDIVKGNAKVSGEVHQIHVTEGATADGTNPVEVFLNKESGVDEIVLNAKTNVVVEQPKDHIDVEATEKKVAVYVEEGANNSTAKAQNGGVIYVKAKVPCTITADGTSEAEDGTHASSTVIIESGAAGSEVVAKGGASIDLTANGNCSASAEGKAEGQGDDPDTPSTITVKEVKDETIVIDANESDGGEIDTKPGAEGAVKFFVAQIVDGAKYESLYDAVAAAESGAKIEMIDNSTETKGFTFAKSLTIDLCQFKVSYDSSAGTEQFPNTRAITVGGSDAIAVTIENGTIAVQNNIYGPFRFDNSNADIVLNDLVLNNGMAYGLGIKLVKAKSLSMEGCTVNSVVGGGLEQNYACPVTISDCEFDQTELDTQHPWISSAVSVCYNGVINVDSGSYSGYTAAYVFSSGGTINISGGTFEGRDAAISLDNNTWEPGYAASSVVNVTGGTFTGALRVSGWGGAGTSPVSALNISGGTFTADPGKLFYTNPGTISISGGTFSEDPTAYVEEGYIVINNGDGTWTVVEDAVAQIGTTTYGTLAKAFAAVKANEEIVVLKNCEVKDHIDVDKSPVTLNLNGFTVENSVKNARMLDMTTWNGKLTINGNGKLLIDLNKNINSYGFVRMQTSAQTLKMENVTMEGATDGAAFLRFNQNNQKMEVNNCVLKLVDHSSADGVLIYNYGTNNQCSVKNTTINVTSEFKHPNSMIMCEKAACTFENVQYVSDVCPTGLYSASATYTNCNIDLQRGPKSTLNLNPQWPWLAAAVSTSLGAQVTIESGVYKGYYGVYVYSSGGFITIEDGVFEGSEAVINMDNNTWEPGYAGESGITIKGGTFNGSIKASAWGAAGTNPVAAISIQGGAFTVESSETLFTPNNASILVSGGIFSQDPTPYLKSGYKVIDNPDANANVYPYMVVAE